MPMPKCLWLVDKDLLMICGGSVVDKIPKDTGAPWSRPLRALKYEAQWDRVASSWFGRWRPLGLHWKFSNSWSHDSLYNIVYPQQIFRFSRIAALRNPILTWWSSSSSSWRWSWSRGRRWGCSWTWWAWPWSCWGPWRSWPWRCWGPWGALGISGRAAGGWLVVISRKIFWWCSLLCWWLWRESSPGDGWRCWEVGKDATLHLVGNTYQRVIGNTDDGTSTDIHVEFLL